MKKKSIQYPENLICDEAQENDDIKNAYKTLVQGADGSLPDGSILDEEDLDLVNTENLMQTPIVKGKGDRNSSIQGYMETKDTSMMEKIPKIPNDADECSDDSLLYDAF